MRQPTTYEQQIYFISTVTHKRLRFFVRIEYARKLGEIIVNACRMKSFVLFAYCILPDHMHLLVQKDSFFNTSGALEKAPFREGTDMGKASFRGMIDEDVRVVVPTHLQPGLSSPTRRAYSLSDLMQSIKGNFSWSMTRGKLWQEGYDARIIATPERLENTVQYVQYNYRKKNLPEAYGQRPFVYCDWQKIKMFL